MIQAYVKINDVYFCAIYKVDVPDNLPELKILRESILKKHIKKYSIAI